MLITRAEKQAFADAVVSSYEELEKQLMLNIIKHIKRYDKPIDSDDWLMEELARIGKLNQENIKTIARATKSINFDIEKMCNEVADRVMTRMEAMLPADQLHIVDKHSVRQTKDAGRSEAVERTVNTLYKQAVQSMNLTNTTMLYKSRDSFKEIVNNVIDHALQINGKSEYTDILSKHARSQLIGAESMTQAVREAIKDFNNKGIPAFVDRAGRNWSPEAYVSMNMRTTAGKVATESMMARMDDLDLKLVYVSSHSGARPKCAPYQGKVFDKHNGRGTVEDLNGRKIRYEPWSSTSYGEPDGLLGINCGHHIIPFIPGVSRARWEPTEDLRENRAEYEKMQHQRGLERNVRKAKRLRDMYRQSGDEEGFQKADEAVGTATKQLEKYVKDNGLLRRKDRESVVNTKATGQKALQEDVKVVKSIEVKAKNENKKKPNKEVLKEKEIVFKNLTEEEFKAMQHTITKEERKVVYGRSHFSGYINSSEAKYINAQLRNGETLTGSRKEVADCLTNIINNNTIKEDIVVYRYVTADVLEKINGIKLPKMSILKSKEESYNDIMKALSSAEIGHVYTEKGFMSTSGVSSKNVFTDRPLEMRIKVKAGTNAYVTTNKKESEIIFGTESNIKLNSIELDTSGVWKYIAWYEMV